MKRQAIIRDLFEPAGPRVDSRGGRSAAGEDAPLGDARITARAVLTASCARPLGRAVRAALDRGARSLRLDLLGVRAADAVALAALLQSARLAEQRNVPCSIAVGPELYRAIVDARLVDELGVRPSPPDGGAADGMDDAGAAGMLVQPDHPVLAQHGRVQLRQAGPEDIPLFKQWAAYPFLELMVGSELLYHCRHLPEDDGLLMAAIVHDPRGLTLVAETVPAGPPVGFVRLYAIDLVSGFGFLESVVAETAALRKGVGIQASRLLLAYAQDVMNIRRVETKAYAYNVLSINALRRNGFHQEGVLRQARFHEDKAWDILVFAMVERELERARRQTSFPDFGLWAEP
jgi:RimJ/RimL family protein N-acetyltransferase